MNATEKAFNSRKVRARFNEIASGKYVREKKVRLTEDKYECAKCGKLENLVITRGRASLCKKCYDEHLAKRKAIRELNRIADEMIRGEEVK